MGLVTTIRQGQSGWARARQSSAFGQEQREALARDIGPPQDMMRPSWRDSRAPACRAAARHERHLFRVHRSRRCRRELDRGRAVSVRHGSCSCVGTQRELHDGMGSRTRCADGAAADQAAWSMLRPAALAR